ncbi:M48 family metallopeptidase [Angustibacter luteus]|uniref:M48 family metallopeptidase n=1 Tax=Angustibacter luteus TaxID=658456 RepID=A0ABW1JBN1_9ACTN
MSVETQPRVDRDRSGQVAWTTFAVLGVLLLVAAAVLVPWHPWSGSTVHSTPALDFTAQQLKRDSTFHADLRIWTYPRLLVGLTATLILGLTPLGSRLVGRAGRLLGGSWPATVVAGTLALTVVSVLVALPFSVAAELVLRRYGLSTQDWAGWTVDLLRGTGISCLVTALALLVVVGLARRWPRWWWAPCAGLAAVLVVVGSLLYPVLIEPLSNTFTPLAAGQLRTDLLQLAADDGQPVRDVLVADASRRTTAENAYVSGFGSTRRLVVYDTLLHRASPAEVEAVVAHELGHVANHDVRHGTTLGALGAVWAVVGLGLLTGGRWWRRRAGVRGVGDPRSIAFLLAVLAAGTWLAAPVTNLVSRNIETRADVHALDLTRDPATVADMQRGLALANISDLDPRWYRELFFENHPSSAWRVALARAWAQDHGLPAIPPVADP